MAPISRSILKPCALTIFVALVVARLSLAFCPCGTENLLDFNEFNNENNSGKLPPNWILSDKKAFNVISRVPDEVYEANTKFERWFRPVLSITGKDKDVRSTAASASILLKPQYSIKWFVDFAIMTPGTTLTISLYGEKKRPLLLKRFNYDNSINWVRKFEEVTEFDLPTEIYAQIETSSTNDDSLVYIRYISFCAFENFNNHGPSHINPSRDPSDLLTDIDPGEWSTSGNVFFNTTLSSSLTSIPINMRKGSMMVTKFNATTNEVPHVFCGELLNKFDDFPLQIFINHMRKDVLSYFQESDSSIGCPDASPCKKTQFLVYVGSLPPKVVLAISKNADSKVRDIYVTRLSLVPVRFHGQFKRQRRAFQSDEL